MGFSVTSKYNENDIIQGMNMNEDQNLRRSNHNHPHYTKSSGGRTNLASCVVTTVFLLAAAAVAVYFFVVQPKQPAIAVNAVRFPTFSNGTVNFEFFQYLTVTNPNRDELSHYDSSLQIVYSVQPMGIVFIPAGRIGGGGSQKISPKFDLQKYPLSSPLKAAIVEGSNGVPVEGFAAGGTPMEVETRMKLEGKVRVLKVFMHRVESGVKCEVMIESTRGTVLGFRC